jgi:hypothetical protein
MPGGYVVRDANGQAFPYIYSRDNHAEAPQAKTLTKDEAQRSASRHQPAAIVGMPRRLRDAAGR